MVYIAILLMLLPGYHLDDWTTLLANLLLGILTISAAFSKKYH